MLFKTALEFIRVFVKWEETFFLREKPLSFFANCKLSELSTTIENATQRSGGVKGYFKSGFNGEVKNDAVYLRKRPFIFFWPSSHYYSGKITEEDDLLYIRGKYRVNPPLKIFVLIWANSHMAFVFFTLVMAFFSTLHSTIEGNSVVLAEPLAYFGFAFLTFLLALVLCWITYLGDNAKDVVSFFSGLNLIELSQSGSLGNRGKEGGP